MVGDLDEEASHAFSSVIVAGDGVDHLDGVHQGWQSLFDRLRIANVEWFEELLKGLQVLNVVFGFRERLSDLVVNTSPVGGCHVDLLIMDTKLILHLVTSLLEHIVDSAAVLGAELFGNLG